MSDVSRNRVVAAFGGGIGGMKRSSALGKLMRYCRRHFFALACVLLLAVGGVFLTVYATSFLRELTDYIEHASRTAGNAVAMADVIDLSNVMRLGLTLVGMYIGSALCSFLQAFFMAGVNQKIALRLRGDIAEKIDRLPMRYFDAHAVGDTLSRITNDVDTVAQSMNASIATALTAGVQIIIVIFMMFFTNWQMTLTAFVTVPFSFSVLFFVVRVSQKYFRAQQRELGALNGQAEEFYSGLELLRAYNAQERAVKTFEEQNERLKRAMFRANTLSGLSHPLTTFVSKLGYVAICVVGGILMARGMATLGALAAFLIYINLFQSPLSQLGQVAAQFQQASAAAGRVFEFLEEEEESKEEAKAVVDPATARGEVEFSHVKFGYDPAKPVIRDFNAKIRPGQKVAIVGPTGAGKTTFINLLMRFYEAEGEIKIDGVPVRDMSRRNVRDLFSMVLQDAWVFEGTLKENIVYCKENVSRERLVEAVKAAEIYHMARSLPQGGDTVIREDSLSGGQKQLITIARAMVDDSPMLILDEATSNVDTRTEKTVQRAMDKLAEGRTSFVIAHRLSTIKNADLILVLDKGDVVEQGTHESLLRKGGIYAALYNSQFAS